MSAPDLLTLQRWMSRVVRSTDSVADALTDADTNSLVSASQLHAGAVVIDNNGGTAPRPLDPVGRLGVYAGGYFARLIGVLRSDYPGVAQALGDEMFELIATQYIDAHPSQHPNLNHLGAAFPRYLSTLTEEPAPFAAALAKLELAMVEAFHAPHTTDSLDEAALAAIAPEDWPAVHFATAPSLRLVATEYPVAPFLQSIFDGNMPSIPQPEPGFTAVYRKGYVVWRSKLSASGFATLTALRDGASFGEALAHAGDDADQVGGWFREWTGEAILTGTILGDGEPTDRRPTE